MADLILRKRPAIQKGEIGMFLDTEVFREEFDSIKQNTDVTVEATQSRNPKQFRLFWALAAKIADSGVMGDATQRDVVDYLLLKCKHVKYITTNFRGGVDTMVVPKSIRFASMDQTAFNRLFDRALFVIASEILPEMPESELRSAVEQMAGVSAPEPKPRRPAGATPAPAPADTPASPSPAAIGEAAAQAPVQRKSIGETK